MKDDTLGLLVILAIIGIGAYGGVKNMQRTGSTLTIEQRITLAQNQVDNLKTKIQNEEDSKNASQYRGVVFLKYVNRSADPKQEYLTIQVDNSIKTNIPLVGWKIKSLNTGQEYDIPKGTDLFFTNSLNSEGNIILAPGDIVYLITGQSPIGYSFRTNECSGYLQQFQTFTPYITSMCPRPSDENLSSIPKNALNDSCFDYLDSMSRCRVETDNFPPTLTSECKNFIEDKLNYKSCVNIHKNDKDFYKQEWRMYLKRSDSIWKQNREHIVLYDNKGLLVDSLTY